MSDEPTWREMLYRLITPPDPAERDPRIPMPEGNPLGTMRSPPGFLGEFDRRAQMREAGAMPPDPRMEGWRMGDVAAQDGYDTITGRRKR
jgi:hypothetical protein